MTTRSKTNILSDAYFIDNCIEYIGREDYNNATFIGNFKGNLLNGIKTPKDQRPAFQTMYPDIEAVHLAKQYKGNVFANANMILDNMTARAKQFNSLAKPVLNLSKDKGLNDGDLLTLETIGSANDKLPADPFEIASYSKTYETINRVESAFNKLPKNSQTALMRDVVRSANNQHIYIKDYTGNKGLNGILESIAIKGGSLPVELSHLVGEANIPKFTNNQMSNGTGKTLALANDYAKDIITNDTGPTGIIEDKM